MPSGTRLSEAEKAAIKALASENFSQRAIAGRVGRSRGAVRNVLKPKTRTGIRKKANANRKLTDTATRAILREASKHGYSARTLKNMFEVPVGVRRIQQVLRSSANSSWRCAKKFPPLTPAHKTNRRK